VTGVTYRRATQDDHDDVVGFTEDTWADREGSDYIPDVYHDWLEEPGSDERFTCVAETGAGRVVAIAQVVVLSEHEAYCQGMRTDPDFRGEGIGVDLTHELWDWASDRGARVARNMVFSWNQAGLGQSRAVGFAPATEFRWATPAPDPDADPDLPITEDPDAAWRCWLDSDARDHLGGLGLDFDESWAVRELTRETFRRAAEETTVIAVQRDDGTVATTYRVREYERESEDGDPETWAEYAAGAWADLDAARALFDAVRADAAALGADRTRMLIPETVATVSDAAALRTGFSDEPDFVMAADLTADYRR